MRLPGPATPLAAESFGCTKGDRNVSAGQQRRHRARLRSLPSGDVEAVMDLFDDDVEWVQPGESAVSGTFHGKAEVMEHLGAIGREVV